MVRGSIASLHRLLPDTWARHRSATAVAARSASCETEFGSLSSQAQGGDGYGEFVDRAN